jgi:parallel beta-helix repeat protein
LFRKTVSGILLFLLLVSTLTLAFNIQPVKAEGGTIYIRADGSVDPPTAPIQRDGGIYTFTDNINDSIVVERSNITIDGAGFTLRGAGYQGYGFNLTRINNVIIKNVGIQTFGAGILLYDSSNNSISRNSISDSSISIFLIDSSNNSISGNNITTSGYGIELDWSAGNVISANNIVNNWDGVYLFRSLSNTITRNDITTKGGNGIRLEGSSNNSISGNNITAKDNNGILLGGVWVFSENNSILRNNIRNSAVAIFLTDHSPGTIISRNNLMNNSYGIRFSWTGGAIISENNIINNSYGISMLTSGSNKIFHNNFINNTKQASPHYYSVWWPNVWDDEYPSGGNYWSDYTDVDLYSGPYQNETGSDGICDHPYVIAPNNQDRYPLVNPWTPTPPIQTWLFDSDFQYNLDNNYGTVEGTGHLTGKATLSAGTLSIDGQIALNGALPSGVPEAYLIATDGQDRELAKQAVDLSGFSYWQTGTNTYNFTGQITNVIQPINNGHYEASALITYNTAKYEFFVNTASLINSHYFPLISFGPINKPPICIITLEKDGVEVDQVNIAEFFDIFAGYSTDDKGIKQIRFSSDDVQDGVPTGQWTNWFDWDISGQDWDASTKIKRWSFATPGHKEVWAEAKDEEGQTNLCSDIIFVPAPALPVLVSPLVITPTKEIYNVGDNLEATFTIKNIGQVPITFDVLTVGGRLNGFIPPEGAPDFTHQSVTLQPNEQYQYQGFLTLTQTGNYHFFVAYYIKNPNPDEKKLLDENNWNTCVDLGEGLTHNDRVKNIIVYEEGVVPEEVSELYETINRWINRKTQYPAYLIDPDQGSWAASVWVTISSVWTHVQEQYDELWYAGVDHDCLSTMEAIYAKRFLDKGDIDSAKKHLQNCFLHNKISNMYFEAAAEIFDANIKRAEEMVKSTLKLIEVGVSLVNPMAGEFASYMFMVPNYIADTDLVGVEQAQKNAVRDLVFKVIFSECKYPELGDRTFENYLNNRIGKITFPYLQKIFENNEAVQFYLSKVLKEAASEGMEWLYDKADSLSEKIVDELSKRFEEYTYKKFSPIELRVLNPQGEITGQINGSVRHDISRSFYRNGTITILFPSGSYICEVAGKEEGTYGLEISSVEAWNVTTFTATEIPISTNVIHQYTIDWDALSQGEEGVTVQVDSDGDGVFEHTFTSDSELTHDEFIQQTTPTYNLTITATIGGTTNPSPGMYTYTADSSVQVTAIPDANYLFDHWELDTVNVGSANPYTVLMENNHTLKAVFTYSPPPPSLSASINPLSASILVGQSVTFTSTVSGGYTPYTYQWYLNGNPVSGASASSWTFTPTTGGIYYVYLKVIDAKGNTAQSDTARMVVSTVPVGGYSIPIQLPTTAKPVTLHIALLTIVTAIFVTIKQKTRRKHRQ